MERAMDGWKGKVMEKRGRRMKCRPRGDLGEGNREERWKGLEMKSG